GCLADEPLSFPGVGVSVWAKAVEATMRATRITASVLINFFIANLLHIVDDEPNEQRTCHWCGRRGRGSGGRRPGQADCPRFRLKPARGLNARMGVAGPRPSAGRCSRQEVAKTADSSLTWWIDIRAFRDRCRPAKAFCINKGLNLAEKPQARGFRPSCCICTRAQRGVQEA